MTSTARWYLCKYVPDVRRNEPRNVGVVLYVGGKAYPRFMEERDRLPDGGRLRDLVGSVDNYRAWVESWTYLASHPNGEQLLLRRRAGDAFFVEAGGERLAGDDPEDPAGFADRLFKELVTERPEKPVAHERHVERILLKLRIRDRIQEKWALPQADDVVFDYKFDRDEDRVVLMERVSLGGAARSWDKVHSTLFCFDQANRILGEESVGRIAFLIDPHKDEQSRRQIRALTERNITIVRPDEDLADRKLARLLRLPDAA